MSVHKLDVSTSRTQQQQQQDDLRLVSSWTNSITPQTDFKDAILILCMSLVLMLVSNKEK